MNRRTTFNTETTSISSKGDDCLLDDDNGQSADRKSCRERQPPQVVNVSDSAVTELKRSLRERDARVAFLEQELVSSRLQLASAKTAEDNLSLELSHTTQALADTRAALVDTRQELADTISALKNYSTTSLHPPPSVVSTSTLSSTKTNTSERITMGTRVVRSMLRKEGYHGMHSLSLPPSFGLSLKRGIDEGCNMKPMNPGSCASGLDIISGVAQSDICSNNNIPFNGSTSSFYNKVGSTVEFPSEQSLKKRKSGDFSVDSRRMNAMSVSKRKNEDWGSNAPTATTQQGNTFMNLLSTRVPEGKPSTITAEAQRFYLPASKQSSTRKF